MKKKKIKYCFNFQNKKKKNVANDQQWEQWKQKDSMVINNFPYCQYFLDFSFCNFYFYLKKKIRN